MLLVLGDGSVEVRTWLERRRLVSLEMMFDREDVYSCSFPGADLEVNLLQFFKGYCYGYFIIFDLFVHEIIG